MVDAAIRGNLWNMLILFPNWRMACALRVRAWAEEIRRCPRCENPPNIWQKSLPQAKIKSGVKIHLTLFGTNHCHWQKDNHHKGPFLLRLRGSPSTKLNGGPRNPACLLLCLNFVEEILFSDSLEELLKNIIGVIMRVIIDESHDTWKWFFLIDLIVFKDLINVRDWTDAA